MKKIYFLKSILLLLCMVMGVNAWGEDTYAKITSTEDLEIGKNYLIVYRVNEATTEGYVMGAANGNYMGSVATTITDNTLTIPTGANVITLGGSSDGYTLLLSANNQYLSGTNNTNLGTASSVSNNTKWKISFSNGNAAINNVSATTRYVRNYTNNHTFRHYATSNGMDVQLYKKVETPAYTVTIHSNNDSWGTVSILGNTITAAPEEGYRVKTGSEGYTINSGTATISNNDNNTFTVTPGTDCDITINFEAIPTHAISAVASPAAGGTIVLDVTSVREGATTTATASANAGYKFTSWSITGTGAELSSTTDNPVTISMGTADAEITANFAAVVTHAINWSINGVIAKTDNVEENTAIDFYTPTSGIPVGYTFIGWSETEILSAQDTKPTLVNSATSITDKTYYAVIAVGQDAPATLTKMTSTDTFYDGDQIVIVANNGGTDYALYQELINKSYVNKWEFDGQVKTVASDNKNWITVTEKDGKWILGDATNGYLKNSSNELYLDTNIDNAASFTLAYSAEESGFYLKTSEGRWLAYRSDLTNKYYRMGGNSTTPNGVAYFDLYKYETDNVTYSNYCTSITSIPITIGAAGYATLHPEFAVEADEVQMFTVSKATASEITLTEVLAAKANMPVILKGSAGTYYLPITTDDDAEDVIGTADNDNLLTYGTLSANDYVLYNGDDGVGFYQWVGSDVENRIYLPAAKVPSGAKFLAFSFNEETGIEKISMAADKEEEAKWFNLAGQRISQPTKGMYIVRGKKVVVK